MSTPVAGAVWPLSIRVDIPLGSGPWTVLDFLVKQLSWQLPFCDCLLLTSISLTLGSSSNMPGVPLL